jgi:hypothetical protein
MTGLVKSSPKKSTEDDVARGAPIMMTNSPLESLTPNDAPLTPGDLMRRMDLSRTSFFALQKAGVFQHLRLTRPIGRKVYSRPLVDRFLAGQSVVAFGRGSRLGRRA